MSVAAPKSTLPDLPWPALVQGQAAHQLALQFQFRRTERLSAEQISADQFAQLGHLIAHADRSLIFWRQRLRAAGLRPDAALTAAAWSRLPILTRHEAQAAGLSLRCLRVPHTHGKITESETSGSSGHPLRVARTDLYQAYWDANLLRDMRWHGVDVSLKFAAIRRDPNGDAGPGRGRVFPGWGTAINDVFPTGRAVLFDIRKPVAEQAAWLRREDPHYLLSTPAVLTALAQYFRDHGGTLGNLRGARCFGEIVTQDLRALCREVFGVGIADNYSCEEAGYLALQCPRHDHLHVLSETVKLEVLDEAGQPCAPGEIGRVIVTPLHNFAMPLLRYDLGDLAEMGPPCDCGRTLPVLRRVIGRSRNRVTLPTGERRVAYLTNPKFYKIPALRQFQIVQTTLTTIDIRLVVSKPIDAATEAQIVATIQTMLGHRFDARIVYLDAIPPLPSGKYQDFISLLDAADSGSNPA